jgi:anaerobic magnesium-protoporphyrin IX monomethyl ester cyclase
MARVLLLNPPSPARPILRDYACGEATKADYYWAPIDLLVLSGVLSADHDVSVLDATARVLSSPRALSEAASARPDLVLSLTSAVSLADDDAFCAALKRETGARVLGLGDVAAFAPGLALARAPAFDGLIPSFAHDALPRAVAAPLEDSPAVVTRTGPTPAPAPRGRGAGLRYPRPRHELFPLRRYRMPFSRATGTSSVISGYGCPNACRFCASGSLGWRPRPIPDLIDELVSLRALGLEEFYLRDFTFGPSRARGHEIARAITGAGLGLSWSAECRLDVLSEALLDDMARAGCEVILVGIESGSEAITRQMGKPIDRARTRRLLAHARRVGIRACGHFILGFPGETRAQILGTIRLASSLPIDYASFNLYAPRFGSRLRESLLGADAGGEEALSGHDVSRHVASWARVSGAELAWLFRLAVAGFYFRPRQLVSLLARTPWSTLARQGLGVMRLLTEVTRDDD